MPAAKLRVPWLVEQVPENDEDEIKQLEALYKQVVADDP